MSELQTETRRKRRFSEEFKRDAVRLVVEEYTFKAAATAVGVSEQTLRPWHARLAPQPAECGEHATLDELREENKRLRRDCGEPRWSARSKKATAYFANHLTSAVDQLPPSPHVE